MRELNILEVATVSGADFDKKDLIQLGSAGLLGMQLGNVGATLTTQTIAGYSLGLLTGFVGYAAGGIGGYILGGFAAKLFQKIDSITG